MAKLSTTLKSRDHVFEFLHKYMALLIEPEGFGTNMSSFKVGELGKYDD